MNWLGIDQGTLTALVTPLVPQGMNLDSADEVKEYYAAAAWSAIVEPGDGTGGAVRAALGTVKSLELLVSEATTSMWTHELGGVASESIHGLEQALARWRPRVTRDRIDTALTQGARFGLVLVPPSTALWPSQLDDLGHHAPAALWVRGGWEQLSQLDQSIALVGSRASSGYGEHVAMMLVDDLVQHGCATVSGAAYGIDAAVHRATLALDGCTIAVMAGGLDRLYPQGNAEMLARVEQSGALVAELPCGEPPSRWRFLARNRLIAALSVATVVVEASARSGSINTAGHAASLGRPLGAVPGPVTSGASAGCHRLIREYDATLVQSGADVRELIGCGVQPHPSGDGEPGAFEVRVLDALSCKSPRSETEIALRSGLAPTDVRSTLGLLSLANAVRDAPSGWVKAAQR